MRDAAQRVARVLGVVVAHHVDAALGESPRHAGAHATQPDESDLHVFS